MWESQIQVQLRVSPQSLFHHLHFCASITWFVCLFVCLFGCLCGRLVGWLFGWLVGWLFVDYKDILLTLSVTEASALNFADVWGGTQTPDTGLGAPFCAMQRFQLRV